MREWVSWNGNAKHSYENLFEPETESAIAKIVKTAEKRVRVIGTGRSSANIVGGAETLISLLKYNHVIDIDKEKMRITVQAGITLKLLINELEQEGWCLPSLPDIDDITLGGVLATGTHGTGHDAVLLSGYMVGCNLIKADGTVIAISEESDLLEAVRVSVGVLGIMSTITLQCSPIYSLKIDEAPEDDKDWMPKFETMLKDYDFLRILWLPHTDKGYVIKGNKCPNNEKVPTIKGPWYLKYRRPASVFLYKYTSTFPALISFVNKLLYTLFFRSNQQKSGTLYDATVTKSRGSTLELAEWTIPADRFLEVFSELRDELHCFSNSAFAHIPMDIRYVRADKSWLSYAYGADTITVGCVTRNAHQADTYDAFNKIEEVFYKHKGRPHWAKRHKLQSAELSQLYPKWDQFVELRKEMDPSGKFLTDYIAKLFGEK